MQFVTRNPWLAVLSVILLVLVLASGCRSPAGAPLGGAPSEAAAASAAVDSDELGARLDEALAKYGEPVTDERRREALAFLNDVTSAAEGCGECDELSVLEHMLELPASQAQLSFEDAARFAVAELLRENLYEDRS